MKKRSRFRTCKKIPVYYFGIIGFVIGILLPNIMYKMEWHQNTISAIYLLGIFSAESSREYLWYVLKMRGVVFFLAACSGITVFGMMTAALGMFLMGMTVSMVLTISVLQFGLNGGMIGAALLFPQYIIYLPCLVRSFELIYLNSAYMWKNKKFVSDKIPLYILHMAICGFVYMFGMLLEVYCNPLITNILIENLKIF